MQPSSYVSKPNASGGIAASAWRERGLLAVALVLAVGMWLYSQWVMVPAEREYYAAKGQPMDVGDLYPRWYGARELLLHHRDPYGAEVSREIQVAYYGHALETAGADHGRDEQRFAYPVYVVFFLPQLSNYHSRQFRPSCEGPGLCWPQPAYCCGSRLWDGGRRR